MSAQSTAIHRRGLMLVLSSPSGAGKTTISRAILDHEPNLHMSVSVTTRKPRPGEIDGTHYHFIAADRFAEMVADKDLLEYADVFGNRYGTPRTPVDKALHDGRDVLFDIDWQGTQQLREAARDDVVSVFILPPTTEELRARLHRRAQDSTEVVAQRMAKAADELSHWAEYDYIVLNEDLQRSIALVRSILDAERHKRLRQIGLDRFVKTLRGEAG